MSVKCQVNVKSQSELDIGGRETCCHNSHNNDSRKFRQFCVMSVKFFNCKRQGLTAYVDSLYSTYLVVLIRLSYDDSIYLVIENMTYDQRFHMKVKRCQGVKNHVQRLNELELFIARILLTLGVLIILNLSKSPGVVTQKSKD